MSERVIGIERVSPRKGVVEEPVWTSKGYQMADPAFGAQKHHAKHAVHVKTLDEAAQLIGKGFSLWMGAKGKQLSLISPQSLLITHVAAQVSGKP